MGYAWSNFGKKNNRRLQPKKLVFVATATVSVLLFGRIQGEIINLTLDSPKQKNLRIVIILKFFGLVKTKETKIRKQ